MALVLLAAYVFVHKAYAQPLEQVNHSLVQTQQEASKTESQLKEVSSEKEQLATVVQEKDAKIQQLEQENSELKE